ncbi:DNA polymerase III subunit alpha [Paraliomyxa miuraensis]|uniref:DNA polymerase III subunit alpha n=1 Tax=Paraliomyxa miuraensis TaxID=376150 RepID=UPI002254CF0A|nr:DNA polymerase III subunit alpha [Paraliomyxa miuraensis]MCX4245714.1 DNA polymerase III subunit alpha [Paraliomyxa miuraensis]
MTAPTTSSPSVDLSDFAHLHLHTQYSLLDGAIRTRDLCKTVHERGMKSVAVTDHGNMFGTLQFYEEAKKYGVKPILGCEAYLSDGDMDARTDRKNYHIVLLAKDNEGFANLQRLVSFGYLRGFYYNPRIDRKVLRDHARGLIGLSACLSGHVSRLLLADKMDEARERVLEYKDIFDPGCYFLELQPNGLANQEKINPLLAQLAEDCGVPLVATNDCHYVNRSEAHAHEVLMCMGQGRTLDDPKRMKHDCDEFFIKTPQQMEPYFRQYPSALENACRIAQMCNVELDLGRPELPDFTLPQGVEDDLPGYLRRVTEEGLRKRLAAIRDSGRTIDEDVYRQRLDYELRIIEQMKFPGYFLIVWDFIRHAKSVGVPVGPGRGSGAGSLVAYSLQITDLDPLRYELLFERFLNPERVSMPDFDIDFCMDRRDEVIRYVIDRYGEDHVGQIATFHSLKARGLVRDVCRVMGWSVAETNELAKLIPEGPKVTLSAAMTDPEPLKAQAKKDPSQAGKLRDTIQIGDAALKLRMRAQADTRARGVLDIGTSLEGLNRHAGMHAAGIVIGNRPLWEHVPCFRADGKIVTQYTMGDAEKAGLVKFDFLGLKTLTVINTAVRLINEGGLHGLPRPFDIESIPMTDAGVYEMISRGDTTGVFQLESSGFRELLGRLRPDRFEDIIAAVALYRPGPLEGGMVDQFIDCKHGRRAVEYPHPLLADVLAETYGVFVYQEQVMQAAQVLAGFSLGSADLMRRAMGKKKPKEMEYQRGLFVEGCAKHNQIDAKKANEIFDLIDKFAGYGFNKSHSAAYGLITYQTAFLKHHFRVAFMAALMTCDKDKNENVVKFIAEARGAGIEVLPPDVNESGMDFSVVKQAPAVEGEPGEPGEEPGGSVEQQIRFGLGAVRGVGGAAVDSILSARQEGGSFASLYDLCRRIDLKKANKRTLEGLLRAGAFDSIAGDRARAQLFGAIESAVEQGQGAQRDRESGQRGLFDALLGDGGAPQVYAEEYPDCEEWSPKERLLGEREALGFYLTGHPLDRFQQDVERFATTNIGNLRKDMHGSEIVVAGVICDFREVQTRSGRGAMGFFQLEDQYGRIEVVVFPKTYARVDEQAGLSVSEQLEQAGDEPVLVAGKIEAETGDDGEVQRYKLLLETVQPLAQVRAERTARVHLTLRQDQLTDKKLLQLKQIVSDHSGQCKMELTVLVEDRFASNIVFGDEFCVSADEGLLLALERLFGKGAARCG